LAVPISGPAHQVGHGAVTSEGLEKFIEESTRDELNAILRMLGLEGEPQINPAIEEMLNPPEAEPEPPRIARLFIDRGGFSWSKPAHAAGVVPLRAGSGRILITSAKPRLGNLFDVAAFELPFYASFQFAVDPMIRRGQILQVGPGQPFQTIGAALEVAERFDSVHIFAGTYVESVRVPSGVRIVANRGVVLTHPENVPLILEKAEDVTISGLRVMSAAPRKSPATVILGDNIEFKDCELIGLNANGIEIHRGIRVSFTRCTISGGINGGGVFISYSTKFLDCRISGEEMGILAFHSALRLEGSEIRAAKGVALLLMPPFQIWPEILKHAKPNGDLNVEWVDFMDPYYVNLNQIFEHDEDPRANHGVLMGEIRSTYAKETRFEGIGYSIVSSVPGLVTLQSCVQIPTKTGRMVPMNTELPEVDLKHFSYKDSHAVAQAYLSPVEVQEVMP
jgi:parallel beta helix pectate lyase-like protein